VLIRVQVFIEIT